jgi:hypothetical protein
MLSEKYLTETHNANMYNLKVREPYARDLRNHGSLGYYRSKQNV